MDFRDAVARNLFDRRFRVQPPRVIRQNVCGSRMPAAERNDSRADDLKTCQPRRGALRNAAPINRTS